MQRESLVIDRRFCGPPESGNGGYVCGLLARFVAGDAAAVRLRVPPPLEKELGVLRSETGVVLLDGEVRVAEARPGAAPLATPPPPTFAEAEAAAARFRGLTRHWFPSCFVCGPERAAGDGLRVFAGPLATPDHVACPWVPDASLASSDGRVRPEFLWAALDCPGAFAFPEPAQGVLLLGELEVALFGEVSVGERCVLLAWELAREGRKHFTATVLYGESGQRRGTGRATWLEVSQRP